MDVKSSPNNDADRQFALLGVRALGDFGATIAVPVVLLALGGKWLDGRYGTAPTFLLIGVALAILISAVVVVRKANAYGKQFEAIIEEERKQKHS